MALTCEWCKLCILRDEGYSNYTVENTRFECAVRAHPEGSFDRFYGENDQLGYAAQCSYFQRGDNIYIDVEHEVQLTREQEIILDISNHIED